VQMEHLLKQLIASGERRPLLFALLFCGAAFERFLRVWRSR